MANLNEQDMGDSSYIRLTDNAAFVDPDAKIQMSLDEIIHVYGPSTSQKNIKIVKKDALHKIAHKNRPFKPAPAVKLLSSHGVGHFHVSKQSPLIRRNEMLRKRELERATRAEMNRAKNAKLLKKKQEFILAQYKLIKTNMGVERMLVPAYDTNNELVTMRKPFQPFNKSKPPPLVDVVRKNGNIIPFKRKVPNLPPLIDASANVSRTLPPRLIDADIIVKKNYPPPLIDVSSQSGIISTVQNTFKSLPPPLVEATQNYRGQPPPLVDATQNYRGHPPPLVDATQNYRGHPPPLVDAGNMVAVRNMPPALMDLAYESPIHYAGKNYNEIPPLVDVSYSGRSRASSLGIPELVDLPGPVKMERHLASRLGPRVNAAPPELVDLAYIDQEDVKPVFVQKNFNRKSSVISLNDRFTSIQS